jgi:tRNA threonylcarbamoyladenosine biosynthesis protein TsaB
MAWLAIDTATEKASYALKVGEKLYTREKMGVTTHAQTILSLIDELLVEANTDLKAVQGIFLGRGPGSFTGLRVACSVVKGLALVHNTPVYPVSNLCLLAFMARKKYPQQAVLTVIDARMQQVYWAFYPKESLQAQESVNGISEIQAPETSFVLAGYRFHEYQAFIPSSWHLIAEMELEISASTMFELHQQYPIAPMTARQIEPIYIRDQVTQGAKNG